MFKIAIEECDGLYRNGFEILLKQIFMGKTDRKVDIQDLDTFNVSDADIIVKNYISGMHFVCQPMLRRRKPNNLFIGVCEGDEIPQSISLPLCISNIVFINRKDSVSNIKEKIMLGWQDCNSTPHNVNHMSCLSCHHRVLTRQQVMIASHFYRGHDPQKTAHMLNINPKTVCAHKRAIMEKFSLTTDCELLMFLNEIVNKKHSRDLDRAIFTS